MVNLTRIYTRTGDDGSTHLGDFSRTSKTDPRLQAYADTNEANAALGVAVAAGGLRQDVRDTLTRVQNDLFDVGADLCNPLRDPAEKPDFPRCGSRPRGSTSSRPTATATTRSWTSSARSSCRAGRPARPTCTWPAPSCAVRSAAPGQPSRCMATSRPPGARSAARGHQRPHREVPQPALGPALHPGPGGQRGRRRGRAVAARRWARDLRLGTCRGHVAGPVSGRSGPRRRGGPGDTRGHGSARGGRHQPLPDRRRRGAPRRRGRPRADGGRSTTAHGAGRRGGRLHLSARGHVHHGHRRDRGLRSPSAPPWWTCGAEPRPRGREPRGLLGLDRPRRRSR